MGERVLGGEVKSLAVSKELLEEIRGELALHDMY